MKCLICGEQLKGKQKKYCSAKCSKIASYLGLSKQSINNEKQVLELYEYFRKAFNIESDKFSSLTAWKIRIFISACYELGYSTNSIARGLNKNHATILYHYQKTINKEKEIAKEFLKDSKHYIYINDLKPKNIYPEGFSYKN